VFGLYLIVGPLELLLPNQLSVSGRFLHDFLPRVDCNSLPPAGGQKSAHTIHPGLILVDPIWGLRDVMGFAFVFTIKRAPKFNEGHFHEVNSTSPDTND
ncbi:MAG: hypothetical protein LAT84_12130, partial [Balneolia bacterium]|nr:hypothetical protein [Balneolia bacterium]